uniref:Uncharacterized protein n=1 Tax=Bostrychia tenella TaxID=324755 RepID=A0A1Z1M567_9FLOR|nr:hypothetical protein [Bostrychia tenella]ARW61207.1 hypothetical protein [Bostrychia tenella]
MNFSIIFIYILYKKITIILYLLINILIAVKERNDFYNF